MDNDKSMFPDTDKPKDQNYDRNGLPLIAALPWMLGANNTIGDGTQQMLVPPFLLLNDDDEDDKRFE